MRALFWVVFCCFVVLGGGVLGFKKWYNCGFSLLKKCIDLILTVAFYKKIWYNVLDMRTSIYYINIE
jgi:hypothetical protein